MIPQTNLNVIIKLGQLLLHISWFSQSEPYWNVLLKHPTPYEYRIPY